MSLFSSDPKSDHVKLIAEQMWHNSWFLLLSLSLNSSKYLSNSIN